MPEFWSREATLINLEFELLKQLRLCEELEQGWWLKPPFTADAEFSEVGRLETPNARRISMQDQRFQGRKRMGAVNSPDCCSIRYFKIQSREAREGVVHDGKDAFPGMVVLVQPHGPESVCALTQNPKRCLHPGTPVHWP